MVSLSPYSGSRIAEHFGASDGPHCRRTYGQDQTGYVTYHFNSLGFRCDEYREDAQKKIYICGASDTFGTGLHVEQTWPFQILLRYASHYSLKKSDVCLMNFSEGGCSNRYISRTLFHQCSLSRPDLVIAHFTFISRQETLVPAIILPYLFSGSDNYKNVSSTGWGRWLDVGPLRRELELAKYPLAKRAWARRIGRQIRHFYRYYDLLDVSYDTLQQVLLLQFFLQTNRVDFIFCIHEWRELADKEVRSNRAVNALYDMLDRSPIRFGLNIFVFSLCNCPKEMQYLRIGGLPAHAQFEKKRIVIHCFIEDALAGFGLQHEAMTRDAHRLAAAE
jgi:hypothetical protein